MLVIFVDYKNYTSSKKFKLSGEENILNYNIEQLKRNNINYKIFKDNDNLINNALNKVPESYHNACCYSPLVNYFSNALRFFITEEILENNIDDEILYLDFDALVFDFPKLLSYCRNSIKPSFPSSINMYAFYFNKKHLPILNKITNYYKEYNISQSYYDWDILPLFSADLNLTIEFNLINHYPHMFNWNKTFYFINRIEQAELCEEKFFIVNDLELYNKLNELNYFAFAIFFPKFDLLNKVYLEKIKKANTIKFF